MENVKIFEMPLSNTTGKLAIFVVTAPANSPEKILDAAVASYVGCKQNKQYVNIHNNDKYTRIVIEGINELPFEEFDSQRL
jgi:hypothetical protein